MQKNKLKKLICSLTAILFLCPALYVNAEEPSSSAEAAVLIECNQNKILYEKNAHRSLPMASTTKIMTAVTALEYFSPDEKITVSTEAVGIEGTSACLEAGEIYTLEELLYALLLQSANDAAVAIAVGVCGSVDDFAVLMNRMAKALGLSGTCFKNPHGLPDEGHYTTAYDLALIASHAMKNECISKITSAKTAQITSEQGKTRYFTNHNKLLTTYKGADGVKTGFTKASGRCLVSSATRDGLRLIAVTLNCHDDWEEHKSMLDWGFANYNAVRLSDISADERFIACVADGSIVPIKAEECLITVRCGDEDRIKVRYEHPRFVYQAPKNRYIGRYVCTLDGVTVAEGKLLTIQ